MRFSLNVLYLYYFVGLIAGAWRRRVSGCSFYGVLWEPGKPNMDFTIVFNVPNANHRFGSRADFSDFPVPSGVSFRGWWLFILCF